MDHVWLLAFIDGPDYTPEAVYATLEQAKAGAQKAEDAAATLEWHEQVGIHYAESVSGSFDWEIRKVASRL